ncbi:MAG: hypothetical protein AMXMBFR84_31890 [Candidatus Hydrogenedentota bacterium]
MDGERGGTWMAVNAAGVSACLLNGYTPGEDNSGAIPKDKPSRGFVVSAAMEKGSFDSVRRWLESDFSPDVYPSFTLLITSLDGMLCAEWDGHGGWKISSLERGGHFFASSLWNTEEVIAHRNRAYELWQLQGSPIEGFLPLIHLERRAGQEAYTPLMDRPSSRTHSITQCEVQRDFVKMRYWSRDAGQTPDPFHPSSVCQLPVSAPGLPRDVI